MEYITCLQMGRGSDTAILFDAWVTVCLSYGCTVEMRNRLLSCLNSVIICFQVKALNISVRLLQDCVNKVLVLCESVLHDNC